MDDLELTIDDVAAGGDGIGRAPDGRVVFVDGAVPGDRVRVTVDQDRQRMIRATVAEVLEPSADRVDPPCPHVADGCGGCGWQHVALDAQRRLKVRIAEESLRRIGRIEDAEGSVTVAAPLPAEGYRTTVRCLVVDGRPAFREAGGHTPVVVDDCMVAHPGLRDLLTSADFGDATEVTLRIGAATGERLVIFAPRVPDSIALPDDVLVVGADELAKGRRAWFHDEVHGRRFRISAESFFQTRTDGAAALVDAVERAGRGAWGQGHLVDLYGGVGLFAACLAEGMSTTLVESSRSAVADARHNLDGRDSRIVRVAAEKWSPGSADIVVADPPRAGLGRAVVRSLAATGATHIVLVSCDAAAFGRDAGLLAAEGYRRTSSELVDLFPRTPHVELVSSFVT